MNVLEHQIRDDYDKRTEKSQHQGPKKTHFFAKDSNTGGARVSEVGFKIFLVLPCVEDLHVGVLISIIAVFHSLHDAFKATLESGHLVQRECVEDNVLGDV